MIDHSQPEDGRERRPKRPPIDRRHIQADIEDRGRAMAFASTWGHTLEGDGYRITGFCIELDDGYYGVNIVAVKDA